ERGSNFWSRAGKGAAVIGGGRICRPGIGCLYFFPRQGGRLHRWQSRCVQRVLKDGVFAVSCLGCVFSEVGIPKYEKPSEGPRAVAVQFMRGERHAMRPRRIPSPARQKEPL